MNKPSRKIIRINVKKTNPGKKKKGTSKSSDWANSVKRPRYIPHDRRNKRGKNSPYLSSNFQGGHIQKILTQAKTNPNGIL